jgi:hypothetical protein
MPDSRRLEATEGTEGTGIGAYAKHGETEVTWHAACFRIGTVKSLRAAFAALALIVALTGVATVPAYAGQGRRDCAPAARTHDCCKTPVLKACCADRSDASNQSGPVQSRVRVNPNFTALPTVLVFDLSSVVRAVAVIQATPRAGPIDLPTLLSTLLI